MSLACDEKLLPLRVSFFVLVAFRRCCGISTYREFSTTRTSEIDFCYSIWLLCKSRLLMILLFSDWLIDWSVGRLVVSASDLGGRCREASVRRHWARFDWFVPPTAQF
eukprot:GHVT01065836.1.p1 GENE.GHVT01065836.1~~GHVT01065836.1.p1  ORF type:complete len:108 (+),score=6.73 GHVT01065836.1:514-837(+)